MVELKLRKGRPGRQRPYCFTYDLACGQCGSLVSIRSIRNSKVLHIGVADLTLQCDECKLRWNFHLTRTSKNIRPYGPVAESGAPT